MLGAATPDPGAPGLTPATRRRIPHALVHPTRVALVVGLAGAVITAALTWTAWTLNRDNEHHLVQVQTVQAGDVIAAEILSIENPLVSALQIESATDGNTGQFERFMAAYVGAGKTFVSASMWRLGGVHGPSLITTVGGPPLLDPASAKARSFVAGAAHSPTFDVIGLPAARPVRIAYAVGDEQQPSYAIYAERAIPTDRLAPVEANSAFSNLDFATYLGHSTKTAQMTTTDVAVRQLPLGGDTAHVEIPFGDSTLTLVAEPAGELGGALGADLWWILLVGGVLLTLAAAGAAERVARRRIDAERDAATISALYGRLDTLYGEQRTIAETLQHALLPRRNPSIEHLEIASRYVAGALGVDIGGDWYSVIPLDSGRFAFVIGDVMGRGVGAATIMAQLRFTLRAYLLEGHSPDAVLTMCSHHLDLTLDGYFSTVLVGIGDARTGDVTLASAGHLRPLLASPSRTHFVPVPIGPPLGVGLASYSPTTVRVTPGSTLLAFTDGLVERRGEDLDDGLARLAEAVGAREGSLDDLLDGLLADLAGGGSEDDIAVLALRWADAGAGDAPHGPPTPDAGTSPAPPVRTVQAGRQP